MTNGGAGSSAIQGSKRAAGAAGANQAASNDSKTKKRVLIVAGIACAALAVAGFVGGQHFSTHFTPGTTVGNINASGLTVPELAQLVQDEISSYKHEVVGDGVDFTISAQDAGLQIDGQAWAQEAMDDANKGLWFVDVFMPKHYEPSVGVTVDQDRLAGSVYESIAAFNETAEPPTNAHGAYSEDFQDDQPAAEGEQAAEGEGAQPSGGSFVVIPEALGTMVSADSVNERVQKDVLLLRSRSSLNEDDLARPAITSDNEALNAAVNEANNLLGKTLYLTLDGERLPIDPVDAKLTKDWIEVAETEEGPRAIVNESKVWEWSWSTLNDVVNGENEVRTWEVDSGATAHVISEALHNTPGGDTEVETITISERPEESEGHEERGRHVDVNLSTQYARLYDTDGKTVLWRSYIVSGNVNTGHGTVTGEFTIDNRDLDIVLVGADEDNDGEPDYRSPVRYWMGFYLNSYGFHDADWRWESEFGGDTYLWDGSHGCVNLPVDAAAELWELTDYGEKVYIHW